MKSEIQAQLETALSGKLKNLCRQLLIIEFELGSPKMKAYLSVAKIYWIDGAKYAMSLAQGDDR